MNILITGAFKGLARNVIDKLKDKNYNLYVTTHTENECTLTKKRYKGYKNIKVLKLDITNEDDLKRISLYDIDVLVCNAAIGIGGSFLEIDMQHVRDNFETNVFSNFLLVQKVLQKMLLKKKGRVILISSLAGLVPLPFLGSYCATKASIIKIGESLRKEMHLLNKNIDIILIEPGFYKTGFNKAMFDSKYNFNDTFFKKEIEMIRTKENLLLTFLEKRNFDSITSKIVDAIVSPKPKKVYKAPFFQSIGAKIYMLFNS